MNQNLFEYQDRDGSWHNFDPDRLRPSETPHIGQRVTWKCGDVVLLGRVYAISTNGTEIAIARADDLCFVERRNVHAADPAATEQTRWR